MQHTVITGAIPSDASYPSGTPVVGTDYNAAYALLLRWWGVQDAPASVDTAAFWDDLADDDLRVDLPGLRVAGRLTVEAAMVEVRGRGDRSHRLGYNDLTLSWLGNGRYQLDASAIEQRRSPDGVTLSQRCAYQAELRKRSDGIVVLCSILCTVLGDEAEAFVSSYVLNRARATMVEFQTHTDLLTGDAKPLQKLLMPTLELNGLVNSKTDETRAGSETFTDVRNLRETISTSERRQDNVIRTFAEFSAWFASCTALFRPNGFHKLERFEVTALPDQHYEVIAQFHWQAETINGAKIDLHTPLTWILVETGDTYMRIERLLPFG